MSKTIKVLHDPLLDTPEGKKKASDNLWNIVNPKFEKLKRIIDGELGLNISGVQPIGNTFIHTWNKDEKHKCVTQTIVFKDEMDVEKGIGFIYNMISPNILKVASVGVKYLNDECHGNYLENINKTIDLDGSSNSISAAFQNLAEILAFYYYLKYSLSTIQYNKLVLVLTEGMM